MRVLCLLFLTLFLFSCTAEPETYLEPESHHEPDIPMNRMQPTDNLIIVTLDGVAWDDVFGEADVLDRQFLAARGNLYGDRSKGNKVDVLNPSKTSYPGYAEIFTGNVEDITGNSPLREGNNKTVLEFLNERPGYNGHNIAVVARGVFPYYLFRPSVSVFPLLNFEKITFYDETYFTRLVYRDLDDPDLNEMYGIRKHHDSIMAEGMRMMPLVHTDVDLYEGLMYLGGKKIMSELQTRVNYFQFVMTDPAAHAGDRDSYLKLLHNVQVYLKDLIAYIDSDPFYRDNTSVLITTDHGRSADFTGHGRESFVIILNPGLNAGIIEEEAQYYNAQLAQTMANLLGFEYTADHEIAPPMEL